MTVLKISATGVGQYVVGERHVFWAPKSWKFDGSKHGVLYFPPKGQSAINMFTDYIARAIVDAGFAVISCDLGNLDGSTPQWANDSIVAPGGKADLAWAIAKSTYGFKPDGVLTYGGSMGGLTSLNWAQRNQSIVRASAAVIAVMNLPYVHDNDVGTSAAGIETVYGGAASWAANVVGHSPSELAGSFGSLPIQIWYSSNDTDIFTPTHFYTEFDAACPSAILTVQSTTAGHNPVVPGADVANWLAQYA